MKFHLLYVVKPKKAVMKVMKVPNFSFGKGILLLVSAFIDLLYIFESILPNRKSRWVVKHPRSLRIVLGTFIGKYISMIEQLIFNKINHGQYGFSNDRQLNSIKVLQTSHVSTWK